jgi:ABC-type phosphate transport system substrate-binding protein
MKAKVSIVFILLAVVGMALPSPCAASTEEAVVIIANKNVPASSLSIEDVKNIFLSKKTRWRDGSKIEFVTLKGCVAHDVFLKSYLEKTASQYDSYFKNLVFTGKGKALRTFSTEAEVVKYVSGTDGAIGYVSSGTNTRSAKVITTNI